MPITRGTLLFYVEDGRLTESGRFVDVEAPLKECAYFFERVSKHALKWDKIPPEWVDKMVRQHLGISVIGDVN